MTNTKRFPEGFLWGAASASHQVEGAIHEDGRGESIWDAYVQEPGHIMHGENGNIACDHYHRFREDVALMREMGLKNYRLSISWSRVLPDGVGAVNQKGLQFYSDLVDELLANNIEPLVTLFHWDLPLSIHKRGGWMNREIVDSFAEYTRVIVDALSDRVQYWMTINEPQVFIGHAYMNGEFAPFEKHCVRDLALMGHHVLLAHGKAVQMIREHAKKKPCIGFALVTNCFTPVDSSSESIETARANSFAIDTKALPYCASWWADPIMFGDYPKEAYEKLGTNMPEIRKGDLKQIAQAVDFYGLNIYQSLSTWRKDSYSENEYIGVPRTAMGWPLTPETMYWSPRFLYERYGKPILITENGMAGTDWIHLDGRIHDPYRIDFVKRYLRELSRAYSDGVELIGYTYWSFMDNFEWASGYDKRFGLVYVDYRTQKRTIKDSGYWYGEVTRSNGACVFVD